MSIFNRLITPYSASWGILKQLLTGQKLAWNGCKAGKYSSLGNDHSKKCLCCKAGTIVAICLKFLSWCNKINSCSMAHWAIRQSNVERTVAARETIHQGHHVMQNFKPDPKHSVIILIKFQGTDARECWHCYLHFFLINPIEWSIHTQYMIICNLW